MRKKNYLKRLITIFTCASILLGCFAVSGGVAFAANDNAAESEWEMTVPQIRVTTALGNGLELQKADGYQQASVTITDTDGSVLSDDCSFKVRGNTTASIYVQKKPYAFKFSKKKEVLGMGKGKKWVLIANHFDPTMLRNYLAFSIAQELGLPYTSEFKYVELWVDGSFRGTYMLFEPVEEGKDRVDIDIESNDGKADFLMEYEADRTEEETTYFTVDGLRFISSDPDEPDEEQLAYIEESMTEVMNAIKSGDRAAVEEKVDIPSFAKFYLLNEYLKTFDFSKTSVFFHYKDGKLYAGPPWDYDISAGNGNPEYSSRAEGTYNPEGIYCDKKNIFRFLCKCDWFDGEVKKVYGQHLDFFDNIAVDGGLLDTALETYSDVFSRNYHEAGWRESYWGINFEKKPEKTYQENYAFLKNWCSLRNDWLSNYYGLRVEIRGDADGNGNVDVNDATYLQRVLAEMVTVTDMEALTRRADIDGNGLTVEDVTAIQRYLAEFGNEYGIGENMLDTKLK